MVSSTSPAFALITEYVLEQGNDVILRRIIQLFQDGKALARDVDEDGNSLIHVSDLACCSNSFLTKVSLLQESYI